MACKNCLSRFLRDETGAAAIEYAVMTFIAVAVIVVVGQIGERVFEMFTAVQEGFDQ